MQIKQTHDSGYYKLKQKHPHGALTDPLQQTYYKRALGIKGLYMLFLALKIYKSQSITSTYFLHRQQTHSAFKIISSPEISFST